MMILFAYIDIGFCTFNGHAKDRFYDYINHTIEHNALCFEIPYKECDWTKMDTYQRIFPNDMTHFYSNREQAVCFSLKNNEFTRERNYLKKLRKSQPSKNITIFQMPLPNCKNHTSFKEHRHDQSIFSLMSKKYNFYLVRGVPEWTRNWKKIGKEFPIWSSRNKNKISLKDNILYYLD